VTAIFDFVLRTSPYVIGLGLITSALMLAAVAGLSRRSTLPNF
jgi:hypothetical protein